MTAPEQTIEDPSRPELEWIEDNVEAAKGIVRVLIGVDSATLPTLEVLDRAFAAWLEGWYETPEPERDDPNPYINVFGIAFGQWFVHELGLEWKVVTDSGGTEIAVHGQPGDLLVFPPNLVAKRFVAHETQFMQAVYDEVASIVGRAG